MRLTKASVLGFVLAGSLIAVPLVLPSSKAVAAEEKEKKQMTVGQKVGKSLKEAQEASQKKQWDVALEKIREAQKVEKKTPFEEFKINEFLGYIYANHKNSAEAASAFEAQLNSGFLPPDKVDSYVKQIGLFYFDAKNYPKSIEFLKRYLQNHSSDTEVQILLGQAHYLQKDYKQALAPLQSAVATIERSGKQPSENTLLMIRACSSELKDDAGVQTSLEKLVHYYPKPIYWRNLLVSVQNSSQNLQAGAAADHIRYGVDRLKLDVGMVDQPGEYLEMAQRAILIGLPGEAQMVMEKGYASGVFNGAKAAPSAPDAKLPNNAAGEQARYERLLNLAKKNAQVDQAQLSREEAEAKASTTGENDAQLGAAYMSYGKYDQAVEAFERAMKKGSLKDPDEVQVNLGIAYLRKGDKEKARAAFKGVKSEGSWTQIARLWTIHAG